jgi:large subunit ribosomal protein L6
MSRIGKKTISVPQGVEVKVEGQKVTVKGPKGELTRTFRPEVLIEAKDSVITTSISTEEKLDKSLWGLTRMLIFNMVEGVSAGFKKQLDIQGVGFRAEVAGSKLNMALGFSHPVIMDIPEGLQIKVEKNIITVEGIDKELVGQFSANIRRKREPEPYKGKGIRYVGEVVRRKVGKKVAATGAAK